jgi:CDP-6-deoxy-D-xylo-4-hexulose-3-dehydrase
MRDNLNLLSNINTQIKEYCSENFNFGFDPSKPIVRLHEPTFGADDIYAAVETMLSTQVTMGKKVRAFEQQYADQYGHRYGIMNNSGSSANLLAIAALCNPVTPNHLKPGDEVIVPALSWATTVWPLVQHQLVPVFVDCDPKTFNFDMKQLESAITKKTRAIMAVHVYGNPCDMSILMPLVKQHKLFLIEDSCESMGARYDGKAVGSFGDVGTLSFYFSHHITTLEGGICVTNDFELAETLRVLRAHGWSREADRHADYVAKYPDIDPRFIFINQGYNLRPTEVQGAMGQTQLPKLEGIIKNRRETAAFYTEAFGRYADYLECQQETTKGMSTWFGFSLIVKENAPFALKEITAHLQSKGVETRPIIAGNMAKHPGTQLFPHRVHGELVHCDRIMLRGFAIGNHHAIDEGARRYVMEQVDAFIKTRV